MRVSCAAIWMAALVLNVDYAAMPKARANPSATPTPAPPELNSDQAVLSVQEVGLVAQSQNTMVVQSGHSDVQYYQDYQRAIVVPTEESATNNLNQTQLSTNQPTILNQPPTVPAAIIQNQALVNQQLTPSISILVPPANDLAVTATDVQVVGASEELQQSVHKVIQTHAGGETSESQLQQDVKAILATGLVAQARVNSRSTPLGLSVAYQVQPVVVRSLRLRYAHSLQSGAKALTLDVALERFKPQLGNPISLAAISQSVAQINQWYAQNSYKLARVLSVQPSPDGVLTLLGA